MRQLLTILAVIVLSLTALGTPPSWESVDAPIRVVTAEQKTDDASIGVAVEDGYIYVAVSRPVAVKVFTILGQLISQDTLQAGTHRLRITARGVYILKVGSSTRRVTI